MAMNHATGMRRGTIETAGLDRTRRRLARLFMSQHALSPEDAIPFVPTTPADQKVFDRLVDGGIICDAGRRRYFLNLVAYDAYIERRRRLSVAIAVLLSMGLAGLAMLILVW